MGIEIFLAVTTALFAGTTMWAWRRGGGETARLDMLQGRLESLSGVCLTGLGGGLDAMRRGDYSVRLEPKTELMPAPTGTSTVDELVRTFNEMLVKAQGGLSAYNDVADKYEGLMNRLDLVTVSLTSLSDVCLTGLGGGLVAMGEGDLTHRLEPKTQFVSVDDNDISVVANLVGTFNAMLAKAQGGLGAFNNVAEQWTDVIGELNEAVNRLSSSANGLSTNAREVGRSADEVAQSVGELAAGAERQVTMLDDARLIAERAHAASSDAHLRTGQGVETMTQAGSAMDVLQTSSGEVLELDADAR